MVELINQGTLFEMHMPYPADGLDAVEGGISITKSKSAELDPPVVIGYDEFLKDNPYRI